MLSTHVLCDISIPTLLTPTLLILFLTAPNTVDSLVGSDELHLRLEMPILVTGSGRPGQFLAVLYRT
jgi:hypothetical protein